MGLGVLLGLPKHISTNSDSQVGKGVQPGWGKQHICNIETGVCLAEGSCSCQ